VAQIAWALTAACPVATRLKGTTLLTVSPPEPRTLLWAKSALLGNTSGFANTAIGFEALQSNTTGSNNTATGLDALYFNNGDANTAIGEGALYSNTTGDSNTAVVVRDEDGKVMTVRYEAVNAMLLNEFLKEHRKVGDLQKQVAALTAGLQKVSAAVELNKRAPTEVADNR
jgi:hypothetical protein